MITGPAPRPLAPIEVPIPEQPQFSSSPTRIPSKVEVRPAERSGTCRFISPSACAFATTSAGWVWCSSYSAAFGRISFSANSRASDSAGRLLLGQGERDARADSLLDRGHAQLLLDVD